MESETNIFNYVCPFTTKKCLSKKISARKKAEKVKDHFEHNVNTEKAPPVELGSNLCREFSILSKDLRYSQVL